MRWDFVQSGGFSPGRKQTLPHLVQRQSQSAFSAVAISFQLSGYTP
ncbi:hypothetical protein COO91_09403 (plasmid) [Nostoc flagelliforme CCNUN1]|uniref:Uncharacterized protein n=1 Tax=Nostoc flagelliforme CCNUN1 TaxID=2038116 RepID=A0A2K8T6H7_9NOSO|nr:hypothetical protein COO91_09403 [Nostoc flagelliforme CCNUN1]